MSKQDGGPAFPQAIGKTANGELITSQDCGLTGGMTLRDYFAAKAMQGLLACPSGFYKNEHERIADAAYQQADAMLAERARA